MRGRTATAARMLASWNDTGTEKQRVKRIKRFLKSLDHKTRGDMLTKARLVRYNENV